MRDGHGWIYDIPSACGTENPYLCSWRSWLSYKIRNQNKENSKLIPKNKLGLNSWFSGTSIIVTPHNINVKISVSEIFTDQPGIEPGTFLGRSRKKSQIFGSIALLLVHCEISQFAKTSKHLLIQEASKEGSEINWLRFEIQITWQMLKIRECSEILGGGDLKFWMPSVGTISVQPYHLISKSFKWAKCIACNGSYSSA